MLQAIPYKNNGNKNFSVRRTKQKRLMLVSNCAICDQKNPGWLKIMKQLDYWAN